MKVNLKYAERQLRFWQKKVAVLAGRFAQDELEPSNTVKRLTASNAKEEDEQERNLSPTPPIRKEKGEEENAASIARVRACDANVVPEEPMAIPFEFIKMAAKQRGIPEDFVKEFHESMVALGWAVKDTTKEGVIVPSRVTRGNVAIIMGSWWGYRKRHPERKSAQRFGGKLPSNYLKPREDELAKAKEILG